MNLRLSIMKLFIKFIGLFFIFTYYSVKSDDVLDLTVVIIRNPLVNISSSSSMSVFGGYTGGADQTEDISLGRESDTGWGVQGRPLTWNDGSDVTIPIPSGTMFPDGSTIKLVDQSVQNTVRVNINPTSGNNKVGAFFARASNDLRSQHIAFVMLSENADVITNKRSITASIGDNVTLKVSTSTIATSELKWKLNNINISNGNGKDELTIYNIRPKDAGIYECYKDRNGKQAMMRLIVRGCPTRKHGPNCDFDCPVCYNGGICDHVTGLCVCPSGFKGSDCSEGCGNNFFGRSCSICCSSKGKNCRGNILCPPDPVGCSCIAGFHGDKCQDDCSQEAHCDASDYDVKGGCSDGALCKSGFLGIKCLDHMTCANGAFGEFCQYMCHCNGSQCDKQTGYCSGGCDDGWGGIDCQIALPYLSRQVKITDASVTTVTVMHGWEFGEDYGTGPVSLYEILYKSEGESQFQSTTTINDIFVITQLPPNKIIEVKVRVCKYISGHVCGPENKVATTRTICSDPLVSPEITDITVISSSLTVLWQKIENDPPKIQCNSVLRYDVWCNSNSESKNVMTAATAVTIDGLGCTVYNCKVRVVNDAGFEGPWSEVKTAQTDDTVPGSVEISEITSTYEQINVTWTSVKNDNCSVVYDVGYRLTNLDQCKKMKPSVFKTFAMENTFCSLDFLESYSTYEIEITSVTGKLRGRPTVMNETTKPAVPLGPPTSLLFTVVTKSVKISWNQPECGKRKGFISYEYRLYCEGEYSPWTSYENTSIITKGLKFKTIYGFEICAKTNEGIGPKLSVSALMHPEPSSNAGFIITISFLVLAVIIMSSLLWWLLRNRNETATNEPEVNFSLKKLRHEPVRLSNLHEYFQTKRNHASDNFKAEFADLENTYTSLIPGNNLGNSRSLISNSFYIKANVNHKAYLGCYGETNGDNIWKNILQENISVVLLISGLHMQERTPQWYFLNKGETFTFGDMHVQVVSEELYKNFSIRRIQITRGSVFRIVNQYHFTAWPNADVPKSSAQFLQYMSESRRKKNEAQPKCKCTLRGNSYYDRCNA